MGDWISVKDKFPIIPCYVYWEDGKQTIFDCEDDTKYGLCCYNWHNGKQQTINATYWMPLLEPPKELERI